MERGGGEAGVGLQQHEAGVRAGVDVQLVVLVPPREAPPRLLDTVVLLSVSLSQTVDRLGEDMILHLACYLGQQLVVDVSRHVGPGLHHLAAGLLPPHGVGVHPLAVPAPPPDPGLRPALVAGQVVVVHREVDRVPLRCEPRGLGFGLCLLIIVIICFCLGLILLLLMFDSEARAGGGEAGFGRHTARG